MAEKGAGEPIVTFASLLDMQVCIPNTWTDEQAEEFANEKNPTGIGSKWKMKHTGNPTLEGADERVQCYSWEGSVHIMLEC